MASLDLPYTVGHTPCLKHLESTDRPVNYGLEAFLGMTGGGGGGSR